jgi:hypothetical protein
MEIAADAMVLDPRASMVNPIMPPTVTSETVFCFGPAPENAVRLFFDDRAPSRSRIGAVVLYRTANRVFIQIGADATPGTIIGILRAGRITLGGNLGVIGDGGAGDWKAWFTQLFSQVDGIRAVIGSSSPAPRGAIEAGIAIGIETGGVGLVGERPDSRATLFSEKAPDVNARDRRIIMRVREPTLLDTARGWFGYTRPEPALPDPMWERYRTTAQTITDTDLADSVAESVAEAEVEARANRVLPAILIYVDNEDEADVRHMFFAGLLRHRTNPIETFTAWTENNMTIRTDGTRCQIVLIRTSISPFTTERPDPSMIAGIIDTLGVKGSVAVLGYDSETGEWARWFEELFKVIMPTTVVSGGDYGPALGALVAAHALGVPTGGYLTHEREIQSEGGHPVDGSVLEADVGLTVLGPQLNFNRFAFRDHMLLTGDAFPSPDYDSDDDVVPPGYTGRPPGYRPRLPPYQP